MITDDYSNSDSVTLDKVIAIYTQELDCCQSAKDYPEDVQRITFETEDGGGGKFVRFKTDESGWSLDSVDSLIELYKDFEKRFQIYPDK